MAEQDAVTPDRATGTAQLNGVACAPAPGRWDLRAWAPSFEQMITAHALPGYLRECHFAVALCSPPARLGLLPPAWDGGEEPCLVLHPNLFHPSHQNFGHMRRILNVDKKIN